MNELEKYLEEKRALLDTETPEDAAVWEGIRERMKSNSRRTVNRRRSFARMAVTAAAVIALIAIGYVAKDLIGKEKDPGVARLSDISKTLGSRETEYRTLVSLKNEEVQSLSSSDKQVVKELFSEIKRLDEVYDQSLKDLKTIGYNERIVNTIFDTYEKKIHLLELIILETNKTESHENNGKISL
jgi:hypothetical protein